MSSQDRIKWNARYGDSGGIGREPSPFVISLDYLLPRQGRALDVAGGSGRHATWLALRGLDVTVVDIADEGLALAAAGAREAGVFLHTVAADLEQQPLPAGPWQVIIDFHFLQRSLFPQMVSGLAPGGILIFVQPTLTNLQRHAQPGAAYLLEDGELPRLITGLDIEVLHYEEGWTDEGRHEARLVARRPVSV